MVKVVLGYQHKAGKNSKGESYDNYVVYFGSPVNESEGKGYFFDKNKINSFYCYLSPDLFKSLAINVGDQFEMYFTDYGFIAKDSLRKVKS